MLRQLAGLALIAAVSSVTIGIAEAQEPKTKYFLMIAEPNADAWKGVIEDGGDMAIPARQAIEAMGGQLLNYYIGVGEPKNYGVAVFPDSYDIAKITYLRAAQGIMRSMQFIEVIPSDRAAEVFEGVKQLME